MEDGGDLAPGGDPVRGERGSGSALHQPRLIDKGRRVLVPGAGGHIGEGGLARSGPERRAGCGHQRSAVVLGDFPEPDPPQAQLSGKTGLGGK